MPKLPRQGDIVFFDLNPGAGQDQAVRRRALVVSSEGYHKYTQLAIVCPIEDTEDDYPMHVPLDGRTKTRGAVLCEHVKALNVSARNAEVEEKLPPDLLEEVLERITLSFA
jgi:mRNA interferase MazF